MIKGGNAQTKEGWRELLFGEGETCLHEIETNTLAREVWSQAKSYLYGVLFVPVL